MVSILRVEVWDISSHKVTEDFPKWEKALPTNSILGYMKDMLKERACGSRETSARNI